MPDDVVYHVCAREDWERARGVGRYEGSADDRRDGFIHFSTARQVRASVARHRAGQEGLVLLAVDAAALGEALRWEPSRGGALFPHLYGPLPVAAAKQEYDLPLGGHGAHVFPPHIP